MPSKSLDPLQYVAEEALRDLGNPDISVMLLDLGRLSQHSTIYAPASDQLERQMKKWKELLPRIIP